MTTPRLTPYGDETILLSRILLSLLFIIFGWDKLTGFGGTVAYMGHIGVPVPWLATLIAVIAEVFGGLAILLGIATRPIALLMALYTLATALLGHHFWTMSGMPRYEAAINFYKNLGIMGGFFLLYVTGPGRYALEARSARLSVWP
ncbi:DoxX family protein [Acidisoma sp. C75]